MIHNDKKKNRMGPGTTTAMTDLELLSFAVGISLLVALLAAGFILFILESVGA